MFPLLDDLPVKEFQKGIVWPELEQMGFRLAELLRGDKGKVSDNSEWMALPQTMPILVTGDWGAGKTSLLKRTKWHLETSIGGTKLVVPTIWFDAWGYEREPNLLRPLTYQVWQCARSASNAKRKVWELGKSAVRAAAAIGMRTIPLMPGMEFLKGISVAALKKDFGALSVASEFVPPEDPVALLQESFSKMVESAWSGQQPVILIDDLDRCSPDAAIALIEGIRLLVARHDLPCRFVVAMDRHVLIHAVQSKFASIGGYDGNRYLEKIFPLTFAVPSPHGEAVHRLVETLWSGTSADVTSADAGDDKDSDIRIALSNTLARPRFANPRLIKRCMNRLRLVLYFEKEQGEPSASEGTAQTLHSDRDRDLVRWIVTTERWPVLRSLLHERDDGYWQQLADAARDSQNVDYLDEQAQALLAERGAKHWLAEILRPDPKYIDIKRYHQADKRLRRWGM